MIGVFSIIIMFTLGITLPLTIKGVKHFIKIRNISRRDQDMFIDFIREDFLTHLDIVSQSVVDLQLFDANTGFEFFAKCHYQIHLKNNSVTWCTNDQFLAYQKLKLPLYILLGIGGPAHFPDQLFLIPFKYLTSNIINAVELDQYLIKYNQKINVSML